MTFAAARQANFYRNQLAHFAEWVTRRVPGQADRRLKVVIERDRRDDSERHGDRQADRLVVHAGRDEQHELGGIAEPQRGELIVPDEEPTLAYAYTGRILAVTPHSRTLEYQRNATYRLGKN